MSTATPPHVSPGSRPVVTSVGAATKVSRVAAALAVVVLIATTIATLRTDGPVVVQAGRLASGSLEAMVAGDWQMIAVGGVIPRDTALRSPDGALLGLGGGAVELIAGARGTRVVDGFDLGGGTAVVEDDGQVTITSNLVTFAGRGVWRVDAAVPARAASYLGVVVVEDAGGRTATVQRGEQVALRSSRIEADVAPLRYRAGDDVDARYVADAIAVDQFLSAIATGLEADYGTSPQFAAFYEDFQTLDGGLVDALSPLAFERIGRRFGPPAAVLTAAVVTEALVRGAGLTPAEAVSEVDTARRAGAEFGLVTWLWDVSPSVVRAAADRALTQRRTIVAAGGGAPVVNAPPPAPPLAFAGPQPGSSTVGPAPAPTSTATASPAPPTSAPSPQPSPTPPPTEPSPQPSPEPTAEPTSGPVGGTVDDVEEVTGPLDDVVGEELGGTIDETVELIDDLLGGGDDGAGVADLPLAPLPLLTELPGLLDPVLAPTPIPTAVSTEGGLLDR